MKFFSGIRRYGKALKTLNQIKGERMGVKIDCDIPGGNIIVLSSNENGAVLKKDLRDTSTDWFYWCFRAAFDKAGEYEFRFEPADSPAVGSRGPAVSMDNGMTWRWAEAGTYDVGKNTFRYRYDGGRENQVVFCLSMQYQEKNLNAFLKEYAKSPYLETSILCKSNKGRDVELIHIAGTARKPEKKLFLSSRHHCCEMTATYVLEGILREALENRKFREVFEVFAVPFADRDGVVDGDQGKNRRPHDHARDYGDNPIYSETANIMKLVRQEKMNVVFDLHCPWIYQGCNESIYFVGPELKRMEEGTLRLSGLIENDPERKVPFAAEDIVLYGTSWNTGTNYTQGKTLARWAGDLDFVELSTSIEIPYANAREFTFSADDWRSFGRTVARAFVRYFR